PGWLPPGIMTWDEVRTKVNPPELQKPGIVPELKFHGAKKVPLEMPGVTKRRKSPLASTTTGSPTPPNPCQPVTAVAVPAEGELRLTAPVKLMSPLICAARTVPPALRSAEAIKSIIILAFFILMNYLY